MYIHVYYDINRIRKKKFYIRTAEADAMALALLMQSSRVKNQTRMPLQVYCLLYCDFIITILAELCIQGM